MLDHQLWSSHAEDPASQGMSNKGLELEDPGRLIIPSIGFESLQSIE